MFSRNDTKVIPHFPTWLNQVALDMAQRAENDLIADLSGVGETKNKYSFVDLFCNL